MLSAVAAALTTAALLAVPVPASAASTSPCGGTPIVHTPVKIQGGDTAAYIHVFYDARSATACAFLNSTNQTWGYSKHMTIQLKHCARPSQTRGVCNGQLQSTAVGGWSKGRSDIATLHITDGYIMGVGRIWWNNNYGLNQSRAVAKVSNSAVAQRDLDQAVTSADEATR
ncbi:hypothetical protein ABT294_45635 [Nonomuraea sp. NPDC000554]|uniref:hypothetical protein n=1 Tax=Nonomuraea sp. NPDC000554 TaxID=3154259 RepID=UPI003332FC0B